MLLLLLLLLLSITVFPSHETDGGCIRWGKGFHTNTDTTNILMSCELNRQRVCCSALEPTNATQETGNDFRPIGIGLTKHDESFPLLHHMKVHPRHTRCQLKREYFSSKYELRHYEMAKNISSHSSDVFERRKMLLDFVSSTPEVEKAKYWLQIVKNHMSSDKVPEPNRLDRNYLSKFAVTKKCEDDKGVMTEASWEEYIEPLNILFRHPFSLTGGRNDLDKAFQSLDKEHRRPLVSTDHILFHSGLSYYNNSHLNHGHINPSKPNSHYFFDAGSSLFYTSVGLFMCAYSQRKISFDAIYGWEATLLEPSNFWTYVPSKWLPYYHFYNVPIESGFSGHHSILRIIDEIAREDDFVSFKLDIDNAAVEIPILQAIIQNSEGISAKIDELFFEFHFDCEMMQFSGWDTPDPKFFPKGAKVDRVYAYEQFLALRKLGIRAHVYP